MGHECAQAELSVHQRGCLKLSLRKPEGARGGVWRLFQSKARVGPADFRPGCRWDFQRPLWTQFFSHVISWVSSLVTRHPAHPPDPWARMRKAPPDTSDIDHPPSRTNFTETDPDI